MQIYRLAWLENFHHQQDHNNSNNDDAQTPHRLKQTQAHTRTSLTHKSQLISKTSETPLLQFCYALTHILVIIGNIIRNGIKLRNQIAFKHKLQMHVFARFKGIYMYFVRHLFVQSTGTDKQNCFISIDCCRQYCSSYALLQRNRHTGTILCL